MENRGRLFFITRWDVINQPIYYFIFWIACRYLKKFRGCDVEIISIRTFFYYIAGIAVFVQGAKKRIFS